MKVRVDRAAFAEAASWVSQVIAKNPPAAVMGGLRITAEDDAVILAGFDYETGHTARVDAEVNAPGEALVGARFLVPVASALKGKTVELLLEETRLSISAGQSTYRASTMRIGDFPDMPAMPKTVGRIERDDLVEAIGTVEHAASKDQMLKYLAALNFRGTTEQLVVAATDRYRIARCFAAWSKGSEIEVSVYASDVTTAVKGLSGPVTIGQADGLFGFTDGTRTITTRVLAPAKGEEFPTVAVDNVFGQPAVSVVEVDTQALIDAVKRMLILADQNDLIGLDFGDGLISISVDSDAGEGSEEVDCDGNGAIDLRFNGAYLLQALLAAQTENVRMCLGRPNQAIRIEPVGDDSAGFIVMPRRKS